MKIFYSIIALLELFGDIPIYGNPILHHQLLYKYRIFVVFISLTYTNNIRGVNGEYHATSLTCVNHKQQLIVPATDFIRTILIVTIIVIVIVIVIVTDMVIAIVI